ncbi:hypothetical protein DSO57_1029963 [Entomophthora muscae]|uniref:Uncharacterized protein n=1 Tax=Entomophthora muscae TaxID=34485 RepID=A0ACC2TCA4_9FUNG|nr:hypothetical protein DSO57_1029963 [Entomophthora muscae]
MVIQVRLLPPLQHHAHLLISHHYSKYYLVKVVQLHSLGLDQLNRLHHRFNNGLGVLESLGRKGDFNVEQTEFQVVADNPAFQVKGPSPLL